MPGGKFSFPTKIAVDKNNNNAVYVVDTGNNRIQKFTELGNFLNMWDFDPTTVVDSSNKSKSSFHSDIKGNENTNQFEKQKYRFSYPYDVEVDHQGDVFVVDSNKNIIKKFSDNGTIISSDWLSISATNDSYNVSQLHTKNNESLYESQNNDKKYNEKFKSLVSLAINSSDPAKPTFFLVDRDGGKIVKLDKNGNELTLKLVNYSYSSTELTSFSSPNSAKVDSKGNLFVVDTNSHMIEKFNKTGILISKWGSFGLLPAQFNFPQDIAINSEDNLYIVDSGNSRIQKFDNDGRFILAWGNIGTSSGNFNFPQGITVDSKDKIYIVDTNNHRVQKFDKFGNFIMEWGAKENIYQNSSKVEEATHVAFDSKNNRYIVDSKNNIIQKFSQDGNFILSWGKLGVGSGEFISPQGIAIDSRDYVLIVDSGNSRIQVFDKNGVFIREFGSEGASNGKFLDPEDIDIDSNNNIYIADTNNHRIQKFNINGKFLGKFGVLGNQTGEFYYPTGVAIDSLDRVYVVDSGNSRIQIVEVDKDNKFKVNDTIGSLGTFLGKFVSPKKIAIDSHDNIFVLDEGNKRIQKFDKELAPYIPLSFFANDIKNAGPDELIKPTDLEIDLDDNVYILDSEKKGNIIRYDKTGSYFPLVRGNTDLVTFSDSYGLIVDFDDNLYIVDQVNRIQKFGTNGSFIRTLWDEQQPTVKETDKIGLSGELSDVNKVWLDQENQNTSIFIFDPKNNDIIQFDQFTGRFVKKFSQVLPPDASPNFDVLDIDSNGNVYVPDDTNNTKLYKIDSNGKYTTSFGKDLPPDASPRFSDPSFTDFDMDSNGNVYVPDYTNKKLYKIDSNGKYTTSFGKDLPPDASPNFYELDIDSNGNVYVPDDTNKKLYRFYLNGTFAGIRDLTPNYDYIKFPFILTANDDDIYAISSEVSIVQQLDRDLKFRFEFGDYGLDPGEFQNPRNLAVDSENNVYVVDSKSNEVQKFDNDGYYRTSWGSEGKGIKQFESPNGIAIDDNDNIYIADIGNHRIQKFDINGNFLNTIGGFGRELGEFNKPIDLLYKSNYLYVLDSGNNRIQKFDLDGNYQTSWGTKGNGEAEFSVPYDIAEDPKNDTTIYVLDSGNNRIQKFSENGNFIELMGSKGKAPGQFNTPTSLTIDSNGDMFVVDSGNQRVQKITGNNFSSIRIWELNNLGILTEKMDKDKDNYGINTGSTQVNTNLNFPQGIAVVGSNSENVNPSSSIFVSDTKNHRIMKLYKDGTNAKNNLSFISSWGSFGSGPGEFSSPKGLTLDTINNYIYVADTGNNRIQKFTLDGRYLSISNKIVSEPPLEKDKQELDSPSSLDIDINGNIYVADTNHHRVIKVSPTSNNITKWGFFGNGPGEFSSPRGISVDHEGKYVYVADTGNDRIQKFDKEGNFVLQWSSFQEGKNNKKASNSLDFPTSIDLDNENNIYVTDTNNHRILKFTSNGNLLLKDSSNLTSLSSPQSVAVDHDGNIYIADTNNHRVQIIESKNQCKDGFAKLLNIFECFGQFYKD